MRQVIQGIYLGHFNYSESSVIGRFYTENYGKQSFVLKGIKSKKSKSIGLLQPLNILNVTSNFQPQKDLNTAYTVEISVPTQNIYADFRKSSVSLFISEILNKSIQEEESNLPLYRYLTHIIQTLDIEPFESLFHHKLLIELSLFLGFYPMLSSHKSDKVFNLEEGIFQHENNTSPLHLDESTSAALKEILETGTLTKSNSSTKSDLLDGLVRYYEIQLGLKIGAFQSHQVLKTVFS